MKRGGMETGRTTERTERVPALRPLLKKELDVRISGIVSEVARAFADTECERIECFGQEVFARPIDTRRLVRIMSRYMALN